MSDAFLKLYITAKTFVAPADDERGASLVEYALLVALIAVVAIVAVGLLGDNVEGAFTDINEKLPAGG